MVEYRFQIWGRDDIYGSALIDENGAVIIFGDDFDRYPAPEGRHWPRRPPSDGPR
ncbi:hypothetical protein [Williamsia sp. 1138]|uniref:hypothetical protein n=1 Tax=Williamsia sp. 1138 TaxID=1903117 RepID=UPI00143CEBF1|nr:hypothetical protein [Williamsia sp. 1138]